MDFLPTKFFGEYVTVAKCSSDEKIRWRKCTSDEKIRWPTGPLTKGDAGEKVRGEWVSGEKFGGEKNRWRMGLWRKLQHHLHT